MIRRLLFDHRTIKMFQFHRHISVSILKFAEINFELDAYQLAKTMSENDIEHGICHAAIQIDAAIWFMSKTVAYQFAVSFIKNS